MSRLRTTLVGLTLAAALAGCGSGGSGGAPTSGPSSPASSGAPSAGHLAAGWPSSPSTAGPLALHELERVPAAADTGPLQLGDGFAVFPYATTAQGTWNRVGVAGLGDAAPRTVATSAFPHGLINWVAAADSDWIGYVDQSAEQGDTDPYVLWRVWAVNRTTGQKVQLASNGNTPDAYVPVIRAGDGYLFWSSAEKAPRGRIPAARESVWEPGWAAPKDILRNAELTPGTETAVGDHLVYLGPNGVGAKGHTVGGDCWSVPLAGGAPTALTHTALAMGCTASGDHVVWTQHVGLSAPHAADFGDDPAGVWTAPLAGGTPTRLEQGSISSAFPVAGDGFACWFPQGAAVLRSLSSDAKVSVRTDDLVTSGRFVAYTTGGLGRPTVIHLAEVTGR